MCFQPNTYQQSKKWPVANILLTGSSGFLGYYLRKELSVTGDCITLGRGTDQNIHCDLSREIPLIPSVSYVVHNAGKAHVVPRNMAEAQDFFDVNVTGTQNLLAGLEPIKSQLKAFVFISSVAVYGLEEGEDVSESAPLAGNSPYAKSKIEAENMVRNWGKTNVVPVLILRLPLVVGAHNPKGNLATMIRGLNKGFYFRPGDGKAKKSMVLAVDVASLISKLKVVSGTFNLTDGHHPSLAELDTSIAKTMSKKVKSIPEWALKVIAKIGDVIPKFPFNTLKLKKMTSSLTFDNRLAVTKLGWSPQSVLKEFQKEFIPKL